MAGQTLPRREHAAGGAAEAGSETLGRYLESIYYVAHEDQVVRPGRLADWLGVSAPTVSVALQRFERDGWLTINDDRSVLLTARGEQAASRLVTRHRLLERWLTDVLGLDWTTADQEAGRLASRVSDVVLARLDEHLDRPTTCPHGNPIPGRRPPWQGLVALAGMSPGSRARIARVSEVAEREAPQLLSLLHSRGLVPGVDVEVERVDALGGAVAVRVGGASVTLDGPTARAIWVEAG